MNSVYEKVMEFERKHHGGIAWRIKKHSEVLEKHLNPGEKVIFAFPAQKNNTFYDIFTTCVVAVTNKRILIGQKRVVWGYFLNSITPDLYNDLQVYQGLIWGKVTIDTIKEVVVLTNLPKSGLDDIETNISELMLKEKSRHRNAK
ncbi:MAG: hypothetical protein E7172_04320 [Firmicutes bacterium]|nr:hypothetical protein [Bacillota bacterium]